MRFAVGQVHEAVAAVRPDDVCLVSGDRRLTWRQLTDRSRRFANVLAARGLGCHTPRAELEPWQSGQDHLALFLHNGTEYLEAMLGAFKARVAPCNVNFRYVARELRHLLADADAGALVYHSSLAPVVDAVRHDLPRLEHLFQVADESASPLLDGAQWYEDALAAASPDPPPVVPDPDDLYILYTGGTTGPPKGVLWQQGEALTECFGLSSDCRDLTDVVAGATGARRALVTAPLMHGAGHWVAFSTWNLGGTVYVSASSERFEPCDVWSDVERHRIDFLLFVGDAVARPLLDELRTGRHDVSSLSVVLSGGAPLSAEMKGELLALLPDVMIIDGLGASESGGLASSITSGPGHVPSEFSGPHGTCVLSADLARELAPGDPELGWLAKSGRLALGYLGDEHRTRQTYRVIGGRRYVVPGDRARWHADGSIELHGRDAVTVNSGGEKIFAEEVERALRSHPAVYDCVVAGRPSLRWGSEVVAVVQLRPGAHATLEELREAAGRHIARFKLPKSVVFVDAIVRAPSGKADYRWARSVVDDSEEHR